MGDLIYSSIQSLDGYIADEQGEFAWAAPGEEVHAFVNDLTRRIGTHLFGRRMYEVMAVWERPGALPGMTQARRDFAALWRITDKVVYSRTLDSVTYEEAVPALGPWVRQRSRWIKGFAQTGLALLRTPVRCARAMGARSLRRLLSLPMACTACSPSDLACIRAGRARSWRST